MLSPRPTLLLYSPVFALATPKTQQSIDIIGNVTRQAQGWRRSIRLQGGYWSGSFRVRESRDILNEWFYQRKFAHLEEHFNGQKTWEGFLGEMTWSSDAQGDYLDVTAFGYVHTAAWRFVATTYGDTANLSIWISNLIDQCDFLVNSSLNIASNTLQVRRETTIEQRVWDEITRMVELGDGNGNPWRLWVDNGRYAHYGQVSATPAYFINRGVVRRWSALNMANVVAGSYIDETNTVQILAEATNAQSIARYGRREHHLYGNNWPSTAALACQATYLAENAWPWPRAVGTQRGIPLYTNIGQNVAISPWAVRPGVVRDMGFSGGGVEYGGFLEDQRDFLVEEVEADESGLSLRTSEFSESDLLETQFGYAEQTGETDFDLRD